MTTKIFLLLLLLFVSTLSLKLRVVLDRAKGPTCFSQTLNAQEQYFFQVKGDLPNYRMDVMTPGQRGPWKNVATKETNRVIDTINKLAQRQGTYSFCVSNTDAKPFKATIDIQSGIEQSNLEYLPSLNDQEMLNREIEWMERQKKSIFQYIERNTNLKNKSQDLKSMMGATMVVLAILGLIIIAAVNVAFYIYARKTLKDRKLI